jgi:hypothetical protein
MNAAAKTAVTFSCPKCFGSGSLVCFRHRAGGMCYLCNGTGRVADARTDARRSLDERNAARQSDIVNMANVRTYSSVSALREAARMITATGEQGWRTVTVAGKTAQFAARDGFIGYRAADADLIAELSTQPKARVNDCGRYTEITFVW